MPTVRIPVKRLREHYITDKKSLLRVYGEKLRLRGFRVEVDADLPLSLERTEEDLIVRQDPPGRLANNHPAVERILRSIQQGNPAAVGELLALLLAEGDDRAEVLASIEVAIPEDVMVYADHGTQGDGHNGQMVSGQAVANRELCGKVLLLFGLRQEAL